ncbi:MAG: nickel pincer cofactor biosynthesis protein LarB [Desulfobulbus sp.]
MTETRLRQLLRQIRSGTLDIEQAVEQLRLPPVQDLPSAQLDLHRTLRTGIPEAVFAEGKTVDQLVEILTALLSGSDVVLATRVSPEQARLVQERVPGLSHHPAARMLTGNEHHIPKQGGRGIITIVSAGTSDIPVAEEAAITLRFLGHRLHALYDMGVAGIHRILNHAADLQQSTAVIVVAGMEGALPSVVAGITAAPVIAVPTSVGYGTGVGGYAALLGMLNSCAPGLAVVNIDNGFGAACMAAAINRAP